VTLSQPPDSSLLEVASVLDAATSAFMHERSAAAAGEWEAPIEAWNLAGRVIQFLKGLCLMARTDMGLAPPAMQ
jgi:hypothetical protein